MLFGEAGLCLLEDLRSDVLRPYRRLEIKAIEGENEHLDARMEEIKQLAESGISEELSVNYVMMKYFKERNERILRSYKFHRSAALFDSFFSKKKTVGMLSHEEEEHAEKYSNMLREYLEPFKHIDFTVQAPPVQFFVQVITLRDCGVVMDEGDLIELKKDRIYFMKKNAIVHLIDSGFVRII